MVKDLFLIDGAAGISIEYTLLDDHFETYKERGSVLNAVSIVNRQGGAW